MFCQDWSISVVSWLGVEFKLPQFKIFMLVDLQLVQGHATANEMELIALENILCILWVPEMNGDPVVVYAFPSPVVCYCLAGIWSYVRVLLFFLIFCNTYGLHSCVINKTILLLRIRYPILSRMHSRWDELWWGVLQVNQALVKDLFMFSNVKTHLEFHKIGFEWKDLERDFESIIINFVLVFWIILVDCKWLHIEVIWNCCPKFGIQIKSNLSKCKQWC